MSRRQVRLPLRLRAEWLLVGLTALAVVVAGRTLVAGVAPAAAADRWLLVAGGVLAYEVAFLGHHLPRNSGRTSRVYRSLGLANALTVLRGGLFAVVAGFLLIGPVTDRLAWVPGLCYGAGAALDLFDGAAARWVGHRTELGRRLDHAFDTLGFLVAPLVGVLWGRLPPVYLALSAARYLYRGGLWLAARRGRSVGEAPQSRVRRPLAAAQMAFIAVALVPVLPAAVVHPAARVALLPSLAVFARDFLSAAGYID